MEDDGVVAWHKSGSLAADHATDAEHALELAGRARTRLHVGLRGVLVLGEGLGEAHAVRTKQRLERQTALVVRRALVVARRRRGAAATNLRRKTLAHAGRVARLRTLGLRPCRGELVVHFRAVALYEHPRPGRVAGCELAVEETDFDRLGRDTRRRGGATKDGLAVGPLRGHL
jgi:hypothetical protein